jgi:hypothetical protein
MKTKNPPKKYIVSVSPEIIKDINDEYEILDIKNIHKLKKNSVSDLYFSDVLDYLSNNQAINSLFDQIKDKLCANASIHIQGTDIQCISSALVYGQITNTIFNMVVFGEGKRSIHSMQEIKKIILETGFLKINEIKFLNGIQYYIECQKIS